MTARSPRGIRNHNPGNLRRSKDPWQGLAKEQNDREFFQFTNPIYGIRALARTLITYQDKHGLDTIAKLINRWAPATENNTAAYVDAVCKACEVSPSSPVDLHDYRYLAPLVKAIIRHENGRQPYSDAEIDKALVLAGVEPPEKPLGKSRTIQGAQVAAAGGAVSVIGAVVEQAEPALPFLQQALTYAPWLVGVLVLAGVAYVVWARLDDRHRGLR